MSSLAEKILKFLSLPQNVEGVKRMQIDEYAFAAKKSVNSTLYELERDGKVIRSESPLKWKLKGISPAAVEQPEPDGKRFHKSESASVSDSKETSAMNQTRSPNDGIRLTSTHSADSVTNSPCLSEDKLELSTSDAASCPVGRIMAPVNLAPVLTQQESDLLTTGQDSEYTLCEQVSGMSISHSDTGISNYGSPGFAELSPIVGNKAEEESRVIEVLSKANGMPVLREDIQKQIGTNRKRANQLLYSLRDQGKVIRVKNEPPEWTLTQSCQDERSYPDMTKEDLKKSADDTIGPNALKTLTDALTMVVMICSNSTRGTGFFVGSRHLMTAAHVLKEIKVKGESLSGPDVFAVINYDSKFPMGTDIHQKLYFDGWFWMDEKLDVAILRLKNPMQAKSPTLNHYFGDGRPAPEQSAYIIGHQNGEEKKIDMHASVRSPSSQQLKVLSESGQQPDDLIFYRSVFKDGTSGAPVFVKRGDSVELVAIHLRKYNSSKLPKGSEKNLRAGLRIAVAGNAMKASEPDIYKEIFNY